MLVVVDWDTDGVPSNELGLPSEVKIPEDIPEDRVADYLSDTYGYCVNSYCEVEPMLKKLGVIEK